MRVDLSENKSTEASPERRSHIGRRQRRGVGVFQTHCSQCSDSEALHRAHRHRTVHVSVDQCAWNSDCLYHQALVVLHLPQLITHIKQSDINDSDARSETRRCAVERYD